MKSLSLVRPSNCHSGDPWRQTEYTVRDEVTEGCQCSATPPGAVAATTPAGAIVDGGLPTVTSNVGLTESAVAARSL